MATVLEMVALHLKTHGFDGLFNEGTCACKAEDLAPCGEISSECRAGYLAPCPKDCGEHDWHIAEEKNKDAI